MRQQVEESGKKAWMRCVAVVGVGVDVRCRSCRCRWGQMWQGGGKWVVVRWEKKIEWRFGC